MLILVRELLEIVSFLRTIGLRIMIYSTIGYNILWCTQTENWLSFTQKLKFFDIFHLIYWSSVSWADTSVNIQAFLGMKFVGSFNCNIWSYYYVRCIFNIIFSRYNEIFIKHKYFLHAMISSVFLKSIILNEVFVILWIWACK